MDLIVEGKLTIYLNDILIFSNNLTTHCQVMEEVLMHLTEYDLFCKPEKCKFEVPKVEYLGMLVSPCRDGPSKGGGHHPMADTA